MTALTLTYEEYIELNGGEHCSICGKLPTTRRLDRDHDHKTGLPRGLLCHRCNRQLPSWMTEEWLLSAADYLHRTRVIDPETSVPHLDKSSLPPEDNI